MKKHEGSQLFDPSGKKRPMKDWLQVPFDYKKRLGEINEAGGSVRFTERKTCEENRC